MAISTEPPPKSAGGAEWTKIPITERARERETLKYISRPYEKTYEGSLLSRSRRVDPSRPIDPQDLTACPDIGLTAFAQLGALRLKAARGIISLFDRELQHTIAEATQSSGLGPHIKPPANTLWHCGTATPRRPAGPCDYIVTCAPPDDTDAVLVVPDLSKDARFAKTATPDSWPYHRFYAGVPIRTQRGINIGVYCVFGDEERKDGLDEDGLQFMRDMGTAVMGYLESRISADRDQRTQRMVRGLGSFVEGKATLVSTSANFDDGPVKLEGTLNKKQQVMEQEHNAFQDAQLAPPARPMLPAGRTNSNPSVHTFANSSANSSSVTTSLPQPISALSIQSGDSKASRASSVTAPDPHVVEVKRAFSRASNIIRESIEVEGVLFLDASIGSFGGLLRGFRSQDARENSQLRSYSSSSSDDFHSSNAAPSSAKARYCSVFGYSTSSRSTIDDAGTTPDQLKVPEQLLKSLLRRYPAGVVFNFDLDGSLQSGYSSDEVSKPVTASTTSNEARGSSSSSDDKVSRRATRPFQSREEEAKAIGQLFPGVRSVATVPMWDPIKETWFAGGFVWTKSPDRIFTVEGELSYLRAFGNTTMAEISRIGALVAEKAKSDVLSSLSHELRSPLHGVIAAVELFHGTTIDAFQGDVIHTIETSGRTLLDTLDHLLDYSKINSFLTASKSRRRTVRGKKRGFNRGERTVESGMMALSQDTQLDLLVEEVVGSVYAGFNFQRQSIAQLVGHRVSDLRHADAQAMGRLDSVAAVEAFGHDMDPNGTMHFTVGGVLIFVDIDPTCSWDFCSQPGALRRVVMNLFGNSLKYTNQGYIWVKLRQGTQPGRNQAGRSRVIITVSDSGKGIGEEYLRTNLFAPFSQEDRLAPGTGLGLSLVRQITATLGGSITVTSQSGRGTSVRVTLPLSPASQHLSRESDFSQHIEELKGQRVCIRGFDHIYERVATASEQSPEMSETTLMENLCQKWIGMQTVPLSEVYDNPPDVFLISEAAFKDVNTRRTAAQLAVPTVVVCQNAVTAHNFSRSPDASRICEFISQPAAPRKLARSLALCLHRWRQMRAALPAGSEQDTTPTGPLPPPEDAVASSGVAVTEAGLLKNAKIEEAKHDSSPGDITRNTPLQGSKTVTSSLPEMPAVMDSVSGATLVPASPGSPEVTKYLLVDDNDINLRILASFMKRLGRQYDLATNGLEALRMYMMDPGLYTCILMDISMPVMDGIESASQMRQFERNNCLPTTTIIALTGLASSAVQQEAFATGIDLFLTKPVRLKELQRILENSEKNSGSSSSSPSPPDLVPMS